jgi:hypothetical protein
MDFYEKWTKEDIGKSRDSVMQTNVELSNQLHNLKKNITALKETASKHSSNALLLSKSETEEYLKGLYLGQKMAYDEIELSIDSFDHTKTLKDLGIVMIKRSFLKPISPDSFRHKSCINGEIVGTFLITPKDSPERLCYKILWYDMVDYVPVSEVEAGNFIVVSKSDD